MSLELAGLGAEAFETVTPGQFAEFDLTGASLPSPEDVPVELRDAIERKILLRRPFSFSDVRIEDGRAIIDVLYAVVGAATVRMAGLKPGDEISVLGPLGNGFTIPVKKKLAILLAGGMGAPPIQHLAKVLAAGFKNIEVVTFAGAKSSDDMPFAVSDKNTAIGPAEFPDYGLEMLIATDDGSTGYKGLVTECFRQWLQTCEHKADDTIVFCCGPEAMLASAAKLCEAEGIECQVSMERRMACGTGLCQGCAVECGTGNSGQSVYQMCCKDGPVFDSKEVIFDL